MGNATAQPDLSLVFPSPASGARDQSFRLIVRPDIWGPQTRVRLSNAFNTRPVTIDGIYVGVQMSGSAVLKDTNQAVTFDKKPSVTIPAGASAWSDAVALPFWRPAPDSTLAGRKLAVSFHVAGESGPVQAPFSGGPSAGQRLERDVLSLSGVFAVIWLEGINDFSRAANARVAAVRHAMRDPHVRRLRRRVRLRSSDARSGDGRDA